ncbi:uroporphyrinogen-III synthase [Cellulosimicrobium cellulans]|uniref:uroporphyrinogen-III synthase n=1 Tax=Cellulosimicrobium cellulans TaxID=1710 RepID=UPI001BA9C146|nr:uroporphyrinogen-III synthase [Cellulosimicrobium cellulans]QUB98933.1 uroporphyrinogen-III synthase [Cellulosimicrobium cellulans]
MSPGPLRDPSRGPAPVVPPLPARGTAGAVNAVDAAKTVDAAGPVDSVDAVGPVDDLDAARRADALAGRTVLVPRAPERAAGLAATLRGAGARVLVSPAIERAPVEDTAPVDGALARLAHGDFAWVVVTSVNAIDELLASAARQGVDLGDAARQARWAAVGPATRRALEAVDVPVELEPDENSARGLVAAFAALPPSDQASTPADRGSTSGNKGSISRGRGVVLLPQGDLAAPTMHDGLHDLGYVPHVVTVYRTVTHTLAPDVVAAWRAGAVDAVVLTSGSVAREVARQLGPRDDVVGVAIGDPTARAARDVGLRLDAVAERPTDAALAAALVGALAATGPSTRTTAEPDDPAAPPAGVDPTSEGDPS